MIQEISRNIDSTEEKRALLKDTPFHRLPYFLAHFGPILYSSHGGISVLLLTSNRLTSPARYFSPERFRASANVSAFRSLGEHTDCTSSGLLLLNRGDPGIIPWDLLGIGWHKNHEIKSGPLRVPLLFIRASRIAAIKVHRKCFTPRSESYEP